MHSRRQKFKWASHFSSVRDAIFPFAGLFACAGTHACSCIGVALKCCAARNSAFHVAGKTAACRPHRWIQLDEWKRLV